MIINSGITFGSGIVFSAPPHGNPYGVFAFGSNNSSGFINTKNLVSDTGVLAGDSTGAGTSRAGLAACGYGTDKGIFAYGSIPLPPYSSQPVAVSNLLSNTGVIATDTSGVGVARWDPAACTYGTDKGIFAYGATSGGTMINTISSVRWSCSDSFLSSFVLSSAAANVALHRCTISSLSVGAMRVDVPRRLSRYVEMIRVKSFITASYSSRCPLDIS